MPLFTGTSKKVVSKNISKLRGEGVPQNEAIARALQKSGKARKQRMKR